MNYIIFDFKMFILLLLTFVYSNISGTHLANCKYASITSQDASYASLDGQFYHLFNDLNGCHHLKTIVLDPGHGGKDHGCSGHGAKEKEVCLSLGLRLRKDIRSKFPDIQVIMTRDKDEFIPLHQRAQIANDHHADLFISIHCNSSSANPKASGSETYVLGLHRAEDNLRVAKRENESILLESNYQNFYGGFDPNAPETHILLSMFQNAHLDQSILLASLVEDQSRIHKNRNSRGVKQAGFAVLRLTTMPSILFETGFLSNRGDAAFLKSKKGEQQTTEQLLTAISTYRADYQKNCHEEHAMVVLATGNDNNPIVLKEEEKMEKVWTIQMAATSKALDKVPNVWLDLPNIYTCQFENCTKYYSGRFIDKSEAEYALESVIRKVNQDAFITVLPKTVTLEASDN